MIMSECIELYKMVLEPALPIAIAFSFGNLIVTSFLRMAFKGKIEF